MATVTLLGTVNFTTSFGNLTLSQVPNAGDLIVIVVAATGNTSSATPTDNNSGGAGTFTRITSSVKNGSADTLGIHVRNSLIVSGTSTGFNIDVGTATGGGMAVFAVRGMTVVGAAAVRQSAVQSNQASGGTPTPVLGLAAKSGNALLGAVFNASNPANMTPRASWTERNDSGYNSPTTGVETMSRDSGETATSIAWGSTSASAFSDLVVEFNADVGISPSDSITVTESVQRSLNVSINKSDSITVTESVSVQPTTDSPAVNVSDSTNISESISLEESVAVNKSDTATITESTTTLIRSVDDITSNISDNISTSESLTHYSDLIEVMEYRALTSVNNVNVSDSSTLSEALSLAESITINKSESVTITESSSVNSGAIPQISQSETVTISENVGHYSDQADIMESVRAFIAAVERAVNVNDTATITESTSVGYLQLYSVSDSVSITEHVDIAVGGTRLISITDNRLLDETGGFLLDEDGNYIEDENTTERVQITESVQGLIPTLLSLSDTIVTLEQIINVVEASNNTYFVFLHGEEVVTVSESVGMALEAPRAVSDSVSVSETSVAEVETTLQTSNNISVLESVTMFKPVLDLAFADTVQITEGVLIAGLRAPEVSRTKFNFSMTRYGYTVSVAKQSNPTFVIAKVESPTFVIAKTGAPAISITRV